MGGTCQTFQVGGAETSGATTTARTSPRDGPDITVGRLSGHDSWPDTGYSADTEYCSRQDIEFDMRKDRYHQISGLIFDFERCITECPRIIHVCTKDMLDI